MKKTFALGFCVAAFYYISAQETDSVKVQNIETVQFTKRLPVTKEIISVNKDLDFKNLGQDLTSLIKNQISVISSSDSGNGIGHSNLRIRGAGNSSINVMVNGVPYNDSESQETYFVNTSDLASSSSQIVIQRGVGTSTNGVAAFGASVNIISKEPSEKFYLQSDNSYGSFNTYKYSAELGTGKFWNNRLSIMGRYTHIHSDGYIDRAFSTADSYNFGALFEKNSTRLKFTTFGGNQQTYQAWDGISLKDWHQNPKTNYSGQIIDNNGSVRFYDNETDNYGQNHYHLLWSQGLSNSWKLETTLHYTKGKGYYENYKQNSSLKKYNLPNINGETRSDLIRKKWLDNHFYGVISTLFGKIHDLDINVGLVANQYTGWHYGNVTGVTIPEIKDHEYYRNRGFKTEVSGFAKAVYRIGQVEFFGDLQYRNIDYFTRVYLVGDKENFLIQRRWNFFNPKAGLSYMVPSGKIYLSYANAKREPNRTDLKNNPETQHESLHDIEVGFEKSFGNTQITANGYYMHYTNQLVLTGALSDTGAFIRANSGKSYRTGVEIGALSRISSKWTIFGNITLSENKNLNYRTETNGIVTNLGKTNISFTPNIIGNLSMQYMPSETFNIGIQNQYVGKQYLDNTNSSASKLNDYFLTDINAKYSLRFKKTIVDLKLLVNNVFNKKYVNRGNVYDGEAYVYPQAGTNFLFGMSFKLQ